MTTKLDAYFDGLLDRHLAKTDEAENPEKKENDEEEEYKYKVTYNCYKNRDFSQISFCKNIETAEWLKSILEKLKHAYEQAEARKIELQRIELQRFVEHYRKKNRGIK